MKLLYTYKQHQAQLLLIKLHVETWTLAAGIECTGVDVFDADYACQGVSTLHSLDRRHETLQQWVQSQIWPQQVLLRENS